MRTDYTPSGRAVDRVAIAANMPAETAPCIPLISMGRAMWALSFGLRDVVFERLRWDRRERTGRLGITALSERGVRSKFCRLDQSTSSGSKTCKST